MRSFSIGVKTVIIGSLFVLGVTFGSMKFGSEIADALFNQETQEHTPGFQINENGETYGSGEHATPNSGPDLISAIGVDGTRGYVRDKDLNTEMPKSPEEALSKQRKIAPGSVREIPLYDVTGKKVIGTFNIQQNHETLEKK